MSGIFRGTGAIYKALGMSSGAGKIGFLQTGANAGKRTLEDIERETIRVTDYASLVFTATAKDQGDSNSHVSTTFQSWRLAIQAAFDEAYARGGGTVILPARTTPYLVDDFVVCKSNTIFCCVGELKLGDYTTVGGTFLAHGDDISVFTLKLDNSDIFAGGSGQNGIAAGLGKNIKFYGGSVKNCHRGEDFVTPGSPNDGGKGIQVESGGSDNITVDGMTFSNCFMAMSSIRGADSPDPYYGIIFNNITADNCDILLFVRQVGINSTTGLQHTVQLSNFYAVNCGAFEGAMQFSRASNVLVSNGIVVNDSGVVATSLIRGNHRNCRFDNIAFHGNTSSIINLDAGTYCIDSSFPVENNHYDINHWGAVDYIANASLATPYRTLNSCEGRFQLQNDVGGAFFGYELRNGVSVFDLTQGQKTVRISTQYGALTSGAVQRFANVSGAGVNIPQIRTNSLVFPVSQIPSDDPNTLDDYKEGAFTPVLTFGGASTGITYATPLGRYTKIGNVVYWSFILELSNKGSATGNAVITGLPYASAAWPNTYGNGLMQMVGNTQPMIASVGIGSSGIALQSVGGAPLTNASFTNTSYLTASGFYFV